MTQKKPTPDAEQDVAQFWDLIQQTRDFIRQWDRSGAESKLALANQLHPVAGHPELDGWLKKTAGDIHRCFGEVEEAENHYQMALDGFEECDHAKGLASTHLALGRMAAAFDDSLLAADNYAQALRFAERANQLDLLGDTYYQMSGIASENLDIGIALRHAFSALGFFQQEGDVEKQGVVHQQIGEFAQMSDDVPTAKYHFQQALDRFRESGSTLALGRVHLKMADLAGKEDDAETAHQLHDQGLALIDESGLPWEIGMTYLERGERALAVLDTAGAADYYARALQTLEPLAKQRHVLGHDLLADAHLGLGMIELFDENFSGAAQHFQRAQVVAETAGSRQSQGKVYLAASELAQLQGNHVKAERLLEEAYALLGIDCDDDFDDDDFDDDDFDDDDEFDEGDDLGGFTFWDK